MASGVAYSAARSINIFFHSHFSSFSWESFVRCEGKKKKKRGGKKISADAVADKKQGESSLVLLYSAESSRYRIFEIISKHFRQISTKSFHSYKILWNYKIFIEMILQNLWCFDEDDTQTPDSHLNDFV